MPFQVVAQGKWRRPWFNVLLRFATLMDLNAAIAFLKVLSAAVAGVLGVAGVLFSYKNADGKLTKWGSVVLTGIVLSSVIGIVASVAESAKTRSESLEQAERTERILNELNRNLQPITIARAFYFVAFPENHPDVQRYVAKLTAYIEKHYKEFDAGHGPPYEKFDDLSSVKGDVGGNPREVRIGEKSSMWPSGSEQLIASAAKSFGLTIALRKEPIPPEMFFEIDPMSGADWIGRGTFGENELVYDMDTRQLQIVGSIEIESSFWEVSGRITSYVDLRGSQLLLLPPGLTTYRPSAGIRDRFPFLRNNGLDELKAQLRLRNVALTFAHGRQIWLNGEQLVKFGYESGYPVYSIVLPDADEAFSKLRNSTD